MIAGVVLAAGPARRFGSPKQLAPFRGRPLLEYSLMATRKLERTVVVLGAHADEILEQVPLHAATPVICSDWQRGLGASLATGLEHVHEADAVVVTLGDQPLISPAAIDRVVRARSSGLATVRATYGGAPGHPVLLERAAFPSISGARDRSPRDALAQLPTRLVACDGLGASTDVDTPRALVDLDR